MAQATAISLWGIDRYWIVCPQGIVQIKIGSDWDGQSDPPMAGQPPIAGDHRRCARRDFLLAAMLVVGGYLLVTP
jgi:hypothetical protein